MAIVMGAHVKCRKSFGLPVNPPKEPDGVPCNICVNECRIPEGKAGFCGIRKNINGRLVGGSPDKGRFSWYFDLLPTNCVADWVCPGGTGCGYPEYAYNAGPEYGFKNLAVFFQACSFNCLFCQNWHFKQELLTSPERSVQELVSVIDEKTSCICYFGGDPTPQLPLALKASQLACEQKKNRILRICWETNGSMNSALLDEMIELALSTGGSIKFDLKAWDENLHIALTGITNKRTKDNFIHTEERMRTRAIPPPLLANTLLVPGYIDEQEIRKIAKFIASINPDIPYSMLAYYPHFYMHDLPLTEKTFADRCLAIASEEGLRNVRIGNKHLLS
ncbi:MAG: radical SAM protein [Nitrospiraceae bacterium]|nr:MAG: radical SAM protein [Nitrospiraceae bacterium]